MVRTARRTNQRLRSLSAHTFLLAAAGAGALAPLNAQGQVLPVPGGRYAVTRPVEVRRHPHASSAVTRTLRPGDTVVAAQVTPDGWTALRLAGSRRVIGYAAVTRPSPARTAPAPNALARAASALHGLVRLVRDGGAWVAAAAVGALALVALRRRRRRVAPAPSEWSRTAGVAARAQPAVPPSPRERPRGVLAVQCKWTEVRRCYGPNLVNQLYGALAGERARHPGVYQDAQGVIVVPTRFGDSALEQAELHGIRCMPGFRPRLPAYINAMPAGRARNRAAGRWYERTVARHFRRLGYRVDERGRRLGRRDGGIDLVCVPLRG